MGRNNLNRKFCWSGSFSREKFVRVKMDLCAKFARIEVCKFGRAEKFVHENHLGKKIIRVKSFAGTEVLSARKLFVGRNCWSKSLVETEVYSWEKFARTEVCKLVREQKLSA